MNKYIVIFLFFVIYAMSRIGIIVHIPSNQTTQEYLQIPQGDATHYAMIANNIKTHGTYAESGLNPTESATWRPPFWPLILSFLLRFTSSLQVLFMLKLLLEFLLLLVVVSLLNNGSIQLNAISVLLFMSMIAEPQFYKYAGTLLSENLTAVLIAIYAALFIISVKSEGRYAYSMSLTFLGAIIILTHPVSIFFILITIGIHLLNLFFNNYKKLLLISCITFLFIVSLWPIRNWITFHQGIFITSSQGATFSKGWNDSVPDLYANTNGDIADEGINLKYLPSTYPTYATILEFKSAYTKATFEFIHQADIHLLLSIVWVKLKSNFDPFPETPKLGKLEWMGSVFRLFYLITAFLSIYLLLFKRKLVALDQWIQPCIRLSLLCYLSQALMAIFIYTGLRFNAIYGLTLCFTSCMIWFSFLQHSSLFKKINVRN